MSGFRPIPGDSPWRKPDDVIALNEDDTEAITELLMGRKVAKVDGDHLLLDDGTVIKAIGHEGGCSCGAGDYDLSVLNGVDNIITKVEFDFCPAGDDDHWGEEGKKADYETCEHGPTPKYEGHYRIWVYAENQKINLMQVDGSDGNGYYGTGFGLLVRRVTQ